MGMCGTRKAGQADRSEEYYSLESTLDSKKKCSLNSKSGWAAVALVVAGLVAIGLLAHFGISPIDKINQIGMYTMFGAAGVLALGAVVGKCVSCYKNRSSQAPARDYDVF